VSKDFLVPAKDGVLLTLRVSTGAKRTSIEGYYGESALKLRIAAPPANGRANPELERFLAGLLGVSRADIAVIRGASSRDKVVSVRGLSPSETRNTLLH
jgi:uncharacterized protein (TIGR00251 family)